MEEKMVGWTLYEEICFCPASVSEGIALMRTAGCIPNASAWQEILEAYNKGVLCKEDHDFVKCCLEEKQ